MTRAAPLEPTRPIAMPIAMTAHVIYTEVDPDRPATTSSAVITRIMRRLIGFDGLLLSDDLSMQALGGSLGERAAAALAAGCDVALHCNGRRDEQHERDGELDPHEASHDLADPAARSSAGGVLETLVTAKPRRVYGR